MNKETADPMKRFDRHVLVLAAACLLAVGTVRGQQDPMYTMYMWNMMTVNPGYAGSADLLNATVLARRQWVGFDGAPATNSFMAHTPLRNKAIGLGLSIVDDRIGPSRSTGLFGDFAYRIQVNKNSRLAFGLKAGFNSRRMNMSSVPGTDVNDPVFQRDVNGGLRPNFGFGMYYWSRKGYIGLATPKLLRDEVMTTDADGGVRLFREAGHYFLIGGYVYKLSSEVLFRPSFLVKAINGAPLSVDLSANFLFMEKFWAGAAYRTSKDLSAIVSYQVNDQLRAGYAYDFPLSGIRGRQGGSHEVMISYDFTFTKRLLRSPRYF